jgi:hypothetical protein
MLVVSCVALFNPDEGDFIPRVAFRNRRPTRSIELQANVARRKSVNSRVGRAVATGAGAYRGPAVRAAV